MNEDYKDEMKNYKDTKEPVNGADKNTDTGEYRNTPSENTDYQKNGPLDDDHDYVRSVMKGARVVTTSDGSQFAQIEPASFKDSPLTPPNDDKNYESEGINTYDNAKKDYEEIAEEQYQAKKHK